jgi:hypothetical protein
MFDRESQSLVDKRLPFTADLDAPFNYVDLAPVPSMIMNFEFGVDDVGDVLSPDAFPDGWQGITHERRFYGGSSGLSFAKSVRDMKNEDDTPSILPNTSWRRPEFWNGYSVCPWISRCSGEALIHNCQWEKCLVHVKKVPFIFPPDDLLHHLLTSYFDFLGKCLPLLHEPSFRRGIAEGQHLCNADFAQLVLLVCAVASRYSGDPRVLLDGNSSPSSAGLKYIEQVTLLHPTSPHRANLQQLQAYCVRLSPNFVLPSYNRALSYGFFFRTQLTRPTRRGHSWGSLYEWLKMQVPT